IENEITGETTAAFEPAIDYVVTKVPRWPKDKFEDVEFELGTAMKSTGEAMAIGRTFEESFLKALRSSEYVPRTDLAAIETDALLGAYLRRPTPDRPYALVEAFVRGLAVDEVARATGIHPWYLERVARIAEAIVEARAGDPTTAGRLGFTDREIAAIAEGAAPFGVDHPTPDDEAIEAVAAATPSRRYKQVDTCAGEFEASTPYYYSARGPASAGTDGLATDEIRLDPSLEAVVIVGGGPIRIGQGIEFDYCTVHAIRALQDLGVDAVVVNNNPETVSTDYDTSDALFFEPITPEEIADVVEATGADGIMVQFGGQSAVDVAGPLEDELRRRGLDAEILGTTVEAMDLAEDRDRFNRLLDEHGIAQPEGGAATTMAEAEALAAEIGYPVLVRPSYVLGGRAMEVVEDPAALRSFIEEAVAVSPDRPVLIDEYLDDAVELDVDAVTDGETLVVGGIMEHVEPAGVHSGDSACIIPPRTLGEDTLARVREVTEVLAELLDTVGLLNVQLAVAGDEVFVLEANPRSSRTVPFVSKATGVPLARYAAAVQAGAPLAERDAIERQPEWYAVKEVVLPFDRLEGSDPRLGPEMKSTGEVMGLGPTPGAAYRRAQLAAGRPLPTTGTMVVDGLDATPLAAHLDHYVGDDPVAAIREGRVDLVVSDDRTLLRTAVDEDVTYLSTRAAVRSAAEALEEGSRRTVLPIDELPSRERPWGTVDPPEAPSE
ncbi:MAG: carbamoyl-phosphate synthase large subunit, partial [Halobacteriota archaeon]